MILGVHTQSKGELAHEFARKEGIPYPICIDSSGQTVKRFQVNSFPDYYLVDREGVLRYADLANGEVDRVLEELLTERKESPFAAALRAFGARHPRVGLAAGEGEGRGETLVQLSFGRDAAGSWLEVEARSQEPAGPARLEVSRMRLEKGLPLLRHRVYEAGVVQWDLTCEKGKLKGKWGKIPTFEDLGHGTDMVYYMQRSVVAPGGMSDEARDFYVDLFEKVYRSDEWQKYLVSKGLIPGWLTGEKLQKYFLEEREKHAALLGK